MFRPCGRSDRAVDLQHDERFASRRLRPPQQPTKCRWRALSAPPTYGQVSPALCQGRLRRHCSRRRPRTSQRHRQWSRICNSCTHGATSTAHVSRHPGPVGRDWPRLARGHWTSRPNRRASVLAASSPMCPAPASTYRHRLDNFHTEGSTMNTITVRDRAPGIGGLLPDGDALPCRVRHRPGVLRGGLSGIE